MLDLDIWLDDAEPQKVTTNPPSVHAIRLTRFGFTSQLLETGSTSGGGASRGGKTVGIECVIGGGNTDAMVRFRPGRHIATLTLVVFRAKSLFPVFHMEAQGIAESFTMNGNDMVAGIACTNIKYHHAGGSVKPVNWNLSAAGP